MLQRALGRRHTAHEPGEIILDAFDLLYLDGRNLRQLRSANASGCWTFFQCSERMSKQEIETCVIQAEAVVASKSR
ncbi:hypothetical protein GGD55_006326 [Rhizobium giardinii]|uniref:ATP-dependent DNA ligase family profile domain-containing protein n=1 Tax=Rhizobium giardinii TaxID=56731 RepID=A0A7W8UHQ1_9HYPH|nr:hypothetical protein [Rhizobium giardinii]MBB5539576.1 hypothetical protein [Rhizobium giardinii]